MTPDASDEFLPESSAAFGVMDWTELATAERSCLRWMLRVGEVTIEQTSEHMHLDEDAATVVLDALVDRKLAIRIEERVVYTGSIGQKKARFKPGGLWDDLSQKLMDD